MATRITQSRSAKAERMKGQLALEGIERRQKIQVYVVGQAMGPKTTKASCKGTIVNVKLYQQYVVVLTRFCKKYRLSRTGGVASMNRTHHEALIEELKKAKWEGLR